MLHLNPDVSCDVTGQLIGGALEGVNHLLQLADYRVPVLLFLLLHVGLQLLDICNNQSTQKLIHHPTYKYRGGKEKRQTLLQHKNNNITL